MNKETQNHLRESQQADIEADYSNMVVTLTKLGADILKGLTHELVNLWHIATGLAGEALDIVKKVVISWQSDTRD